MEIDLSGARLMASRIVGQLHVADVRKVALDRMRQIASHDLAVIDIVKYGQVIRCHFGDEQRAWWIEETKISRRSRLLTGSMVSVIPSASQAADANLRLRRTCRAMLAGHRPGGHCRQRSSGPGFHHARPLDGEFDALPELIHIVGIYRIAHAASGTVPNADCSWPG